MNSVRRRGLCLVLAAPSGGGKSTITRRLLESEKGIELSISATTRPPRPGERDGEHYHFLPQAEFDRLAETGGLLEWARVFGRNYYGTPRAPVERALAAGHDVLFDIDWQGHRQLREALPGDVVGIFLLPPSLPDLLARLAGRGSETEAEVARRMDSARDEMTHWSEFDHVIVNRDLDLAIEDVRAVLHAARSETTRQTGLADFVAELSA